MRQRIVLTTILAAALTAGVAHAQTDTGNGPGFDPLPGQQVSPAPTDQELPGVLEQQADRPGMQPGDPGIAERPMPGAGMQDRPAIGMQDRTMSPGPGTPGTLGADRGAGGQIGSQVMQDTQTVREIQQSLRMEGHDIAVDGIWGPQTQAALQNFQQRRGLSANGVPDQQTLATLGVDPGPEVAADPGMPR